MGPASTLEDTKQEPTLSRFLRRALFQKVRSNKMRAGREIVLLL